MVIAYTNTGGIFHEPPYTEEEQLEMYRQMGGVRSFTRRAPAASPEPKRQDPPPSTSE